MMSDIHTDAPKMHSNPLNNQEKKPEKRYFLRGREHIMEILSVLFMSDIHTDAPKMHSNPLNNKEKKPENRHFLRDREHIMAILSVLADRLEPTDADAAHALHAAWAYIRQTSTE